MVMKKAGHCSVPSNPTGEYTAIFLASLNNFLLDYALDAGTFKIKSGHTPVLYVRKYLLVSAFLETDKYVP